MIRYKVEISPKSSSGYASYIDVTDKIDAQGVGEITKSIDSSDYTFGVFTFSDITLKAKNYNGYFNINDYRSIFPYGRNLSKVKITFIEFDNDVTTTETNQIVFDGIINDEATRLDVTSGIISFKVLSFDSVLRTQKVNAGSVTNESLISEAIFVILNQADITNVLTVTTANINVDTDIIIDNGSAFDNLNVQDALDELLLMSNSCLIINSDNEAIIKNRSSATLAGALNLYGTFDIHRRENIIDIKSYNDGFHRTFTSVTINNTNYTNTGYSKDFGYRVKKISFNSITDQSKSLTIATNLVEEFKSPKIEMEVTVRTKIAKKFDVLSPVSVNYPFKIVPVEDKFFPVCGVTTIGSTDTPLPNLYGSIAISDSIAFKILEINHSVKQFTTTLKLRQSGTDTGDGFFYESAIVGFAKIGSSVLETDALNYNLDYVPSVLGGAIINNISST